jgi:antitoxin HigA-1
MKVEEASPTYLAPINGMRPIHPGEVLREEFLVPYQLTAHALSMALQVPAPRINDIVRERRAITVDTALRLSKFFGNSAEFWMGLQTDYDMAIARQSMQDALERIRQFSPALPSKAAKALIPTRSSPAASSSRRKSPG